MDCKSFLLASVFGFLLMSFGFDDDEPEVLGVCDLPAFAVGILDNHFKDFSVVSVSRKSRDDGFKVCFAGGRSIQFSADGDWTYINCKDVSVPLLLVPSEVRNEIAKKYGPRVFPVMMCRFKSKLKLRLDNQVEVEMKHSL